MSYGTHYTPSHYCVMTTDQFCRRLYAIDRDSVLSSALAADWKAVTTWDAQRGSSLNTWRIKLIRQAVSDEIRSQLRRPTVEGLNEDFQVPYTTTPEHVVVSSAVWSTVDTLGRPASVLIRMLYEEGETLTSAADRLGMHFRTAAKIRDSALEALREVMIASGACEPCPVP